MESGFAPLALRSKPDSRGGKLFRHAPFHKGSQADSKGLYRIGDGDQYNEIDYNTPIDFPRLYYVPESDGDHRRVVRCHSFFVSFFSEPSWGTRKTVVGPW
jgi:hypothetical protein